MQMQAKVRRKRGRARLKIIGGSWAGVGWSAGRPGRGPWRPTSRPWRRCWPTDAGRSALWAASARSAHAVGGAARASASGIWPAARSACDCAGQSPGWPSLRARTSLTGLQRRRGHAGTCGSWCWSRSSAARNGARRGQRGSSRRPVA